LCGRGAGELAGAGNAGGNWIVYIDGGARGNPGPAAAAGVIRDESGKQIQFCVYLGVTTNNVAEYLALLWALEDARRARVPELMVFTDSELLVRQMTGEYRVKSPRLTSLHGRALELARAFPRFQISHVRREDNRLADFLVNRTLDWAAKYLEPPACPGAGADEYARGPGEGRQT